MPDARICSQRQRGTTMVTVPLDIVTIALTTINPPMPMQGKSTA
ncbi:MAG: hypothetical protein ACXW53_02955 [Candidatus Binatia bacterium]